MIKIVKKIFARSLSLNAKIKLQKQLKEINSINADHGARDSKKKQRFLLSQILVHSIENVPFYRDAGVLVPDLKCFPVIDKNTIREHYDRFRSQCYPDGPLYRAHTSGSTGTPFTVLHDACKRIRHSADVRYFWDSVGHSHGDGYYYFKIWKYLTTKGRLKFFLGNVVPVDVTVLDDKKIREFLDRLIKFRSPKSILGYASALDSIVKYLEKNPVDVSHAGTQCIIAMSEALDSYTKIALEERFKCPVVSRYANLENGILAQQTLKSPNNFLVNAASYHIEILDVIENVAVQPGEIGRIVVTDLFNRAMPMIRYDTGDFGAMGIEHVDTKSFQVLTRVEGRQMDAIYNTAGQLFSSFSVGTAMWKYDELLQYQFIQLSPKKFKFILNPYVDFSREEELLLEFRSHLGQDAEFEIQYVKEIPSLSSGKRKKMVNLNTDILSLALRY